MLAALVVAILVPGSAAAGSKAVSGTDKMRAVEAQLFKDINRIRVVNGRRPLRLDERITHVARARSHDMAGKRYFAQVTITKGWGQPHIRIIPVTSEFDSSEVNKWMGSYERLTIDKENLKPSIQFRIEAARPFLAEAMQNVKAGLHETRILRTTDAR